MPLILNVFTTNCAKNFRRDGKKGVNYAHFLKNPSQGLNVTALASLMVIRPQDCIYHCINHKECYSINFARVSFNKTHKCELLSTDKFRSSGELEYTDIFDHYHIKVSVNMSCGPSEFHLVKSDWVLIEFYGQIEERTVHTSCLKEKGNYKWLFLVLSSRNSTEQMQKSLDLS